MGLVLIMEIMWASSSTPAAVFHVGAGAQCARGLGKMEYRSEGAVINNTIKQITSQIFSLGNI